MIGAAVASRENPPTREFAVNSLLALIVSLALQVAVNYANDYSDGVRGTDAQRRGPQRLVASGAASARAVKRAAFMAFAVSGGVGLALASRTTWLLVALGAVCMVAGWTYTGGPRPYGYAGFGELFVFVFFGLVATVGTAYVGMERVTRLSVMSGALAGFLAVALLVVNNIRDIDTDRASGKRTLAVRLGESRARGLYVGCFVGAGLAIVAAAFDEPLTLIGLVGLLVAAPAVSTVRRTTESTELIAALGMTARVQLVVGTLFALGLVIR